MKVETTVLVEFGSTDTSGFIAKIELDDELNLDDDGEKGNTSFNPGDLVYIKTHFSNDVTLNSMVTTSGTLQSLGNVSRNELEEHVSFASRDSNEPDELVLSYIPAGSVSMTSYGRPYSFTHRQEPNGMTTFVADEDAAPFIADLEYKYTVESYVLHTPSAPLGEDVTWPILIVAYITTPEGGADECNSD